MTTTVVVPLLAVTTFDAGPGWMGLLSAAAWLPWLLVGLPAGAWVDRLDHRRVMITADLAAAASTASVPVAWALGVLTLPHLAVAALLTGTCAVFFRTAYGAIVPRIVRDDDLDAANGRLYGTESAMQVAGPGLGGVLVQLVGGAMALLVDTVSFLVSAVCLWRIPAGGLRTVERPPARSMRRDVAEGVRVVARDRHLRFFIVQGSLSNFALTGYGALLVLHLVRDLDASPGTVGVVMAVGSVGGLLGAVVATRARREARHGPGDAVVPGPRRPSGPARRRRLTRARHRPRPARGGPRRRRRRRRERHPLGVPPALGATAPARPRDGGGVGRQLRDDAVRGTGRGVDGGAPRSPRDDPRDGRAARAGVPGGARRALRPWARPAVRADAARGRAAVS